MNKISFPYDNMIALWIWRGDTLGPGPPSSIAALCERIQRDAPQVTALIVKTSDYTPDAGAQWMGYWDKSPLAITGPERIDQWVETLAAYDLDFHAWCIPRGLDPAGETALIVQACSRAGVKSMILDVEPYPGFWQGGKAGKKESIRPYMLRIWRQLNGLPRAFHIGMSVDPRSRHYLSVHPSEWFPFVFSVHPQIYHRTFEQSPTEAIDDTYQTWTNFGRPIIPIVQGAAPLGEIQEAMQLVKERGAVGLSAWRLGVLSDEGFRAFE